MRSTTVYVVTEVNEAYEPAPTVVLATIEFDQAMDSAREFPLILPELTEAEKATGNLSDITVHHRYIDVWRDGDISHTLFFGENGLETAEKAIHGEVDALV